MTEGGLPDYDSWHCCHEKSQPIYCPIEGCSKRHGCARDRGWKLGMAYDQFTGTIGNPSPAAKGDE